MALLRVSGLVPVAPHSFVSRYTYLIINLLQKINNYTRLSLDPDFVSFSTLISFRRLIQKINNYIANVRKSYQSSFLLKLVKIIDFLYECKDS